MLRFIVFAFLLKTISALENGLARTPPMGFMSWERYRCIVDCVNYPDDCNTEGLFRRVADLMVSEGYAELGYEYLIIEDCWTADKRDENGKLQPNATRFPSGFKNMSAYVHSKGLKFGLYEDLGTNTCGGFPGILGHLETDANTFAEWDVDYVKLDACFAKNVDLVKGFVDFGRYLNQTGRPMVYSCLYPMRYNATQINYTLLQETCNLWRNTGDIEDSWGHVVGIKNWYAANQDIVAKVAGPGHWNDPDMLLIGNYGLTYDQSKFQMAWFAIMAGPLLISTDLARLRPELKAILQNKDIIAVNQDPMGIQGRQVIKDQRREVWTRCITPMVGSECSYAVLIHYTIAEPYPALMSFVLKDIGLTNPKGYNFTELFEGTNMVLSSPDATLVTKVNPQGATFFKATAIKG